MAKLSTYAKIILLIVLIGGIILLTGGDILAPIAMLVMGMFLTGLPFLFIIVWFVKWIIKRIKIKTPKF